MAAPTQTVPGVTVEPNAPVAASKTPFARAIESFLDGVRKDEDVKNPFYKEVMSRAGHLLRDGCSPEQSAKCAQGFSAFVEGLDRNQKRNSKTRMILDKLQPLVNGLQQFASAFDVLIQAAPAVVQVLYGGARIVLQVSYLSSNIDLSTKEVRLSWYQALHNHSIPF